MSIDMGIRHCSSGEYESVPVAASDTFRNVWLPACEQLGLALVSHFADGSLVPVRPELVSEIVSEVERLKAWADEQPDDDHLLARCSSILAAFARTNPAECVYDFG